MDTTNSIASEAQDVDKSFMDAEHFLSNFTSLRDECERLKSVNQELEIKVQQLSQELQQSQVDKSNLERHIQKETLLHKEVVWNLKIEVQKSQEERLSWKEKYLDLCIKSSQNNAIKDFHSSDKLQSRSKSKKMTKKLKKKSARKKANTIEDNRQNAPQEESNEEHIDEIMEQSNEQNQQQPLKQVQEEQQQQSVDTHGLQQQEQSLEEIMDSEEKKFITNTSSVDTSTTMSTNNKPRTSSRNIIKHEQKPSTNSSHVSQVESLNLVTMQHSTDSMKTVNIVDTLGTSNLNVSTVNSQNNVVNANTQGYYNLQTGTFDLNNQSQTDNTTTFILQTPDATFCATAVIENPQRNQYTNATDSAFVIKPNNTFNNAQETFGNVVEGESEDSSDENTEFNYRCSLCNFTFSDEDMLSKHMKAKHTAKTYICKDCGKAYSTKGSLAQHVHHYHRHPNAYTCEVCEKKFNRKDFLIKHLKTHTEDREFECKQCEKKFKTNASLSAHVNGTHNDTRRFVCDYCGMRTSWRLSYLEHMKLHTGEPRKSTRKKKAQQQQQQPQLSQLVNETGEVVQFISTTEG